MSKPIRRLVTGHDQSGKAIVVSDGAAPMVFTNPARPGYSLTQLWMTDGAPAVIDVGPDPTDRPVAIEPSAHGTVIRVIEFPPESEETRAFSPEQARAIFAGMGSKGAATGRSDSRHPLMHRTETIDYAVVIEGGITLVLDDSDVVLNVGDVVIQRGTNHAWSNRTGKACRMLFVLVDAALSPEIAASIAAFDAAADGTPTVFASEKP